MPRESSRFNDGELVSKSDFLLGLQCSKLFWHWYRARYDFPPVGQATQAMFDQGHEVSSQARRLFSSGMEVPHVGRSSKEVAQATESLLARRVPLFEAGFAFDGLSARVDILVPVGEAQWDLYEVKAVTSPKDIHFTDIAFQAHLVAGAGLNLRRCFLVHLNPDYMRQESLDPKELFKVSDCSSVASVRSREIPERMERLREVLRKGESPHVAIGPHCRSPYECPLQKKCRAFLPEDNVTELYAGSRKGFQLLERGIHRLEEIPEDFGLTERQEVQRAAARTGKPQIVRRAVSTFLNQLDCPVTFVDFETYSLALPPFDGLSPYQRVPFQFSVHVVRQEGSEPEAISFLADGQCDPRLEFMERLRDALGETGSIIVYNRVFEVGVLKECAAAFPKFAAWVTNVNNRVVDLLQPFRAFRYYHPSQHGSASMKAVLPALTGEGYDHLAIQDGQAASLEYLRVTFGHVPADERDRVRQRLLDYCGLDTLGMIQIMEELRRICRA